MTQVAVYNIEGAQVGEIELNDSIFNRQVNVPVMHQAATLFLASQRRGTHATKTRAMVSGGGRKPWRQKGTGRARAGSSRSPIWRAGEVLKVLKLVQKLVVVVESLGDKKELDVLDKVLFVLLNGLVVVLFLLQNLEIFLLN